jgi:hypothetical protein
MPTMILGAPGYAGVSAVVPVRPLVPLGVPLVLGDYVLIDPPGATRRRRTSVRGNLPRPGSVRIIAVHVAVWALRPGSG